MKRYAQTDDDKVCMQALVREWQRSSLIEESQGRRMGADLPVNLKRTNPFLRVLLLLFTALIIAASFAFVLITLHALSLHGGDDSTVAVVCFFAAPLCFGLAEFLIGTFHLYRFGIEEACAVSAVIFIAAGLKIGMSDDAVVCAVAGLAALGIFLRFGYVYAAVGAIGFAAAIPFQFSFSGSQERMLAAVILAAIFAIARWSRTDHGIIEAAAWGGIYVALNLQFGFTLYHGAFYWFTYVMIWILPAVGLWFALRHKHRELIDANVLMLLASLTTNKPYLGLTRRPWDPIVFGLFLMGTAIIIRQWLKRGTGGLRHGFTPARLLASDLRLLSIAGTASSALQVNVPTATPVESRPDFGGGRSGGAGATGSF